MPGIQLDELDLRILGILQNDASLSNVALAARVHTSPPTCLRRVRSLVEAGVIRRQIVVLDAAQMNWKLTAIVEVSLDRQSSEDLDAFESYIGAEPAVTQCYRVTPGPDFMLVVEMTDMNEYDELARRLFRNSANIRNVRTFFSTRRSKFEANARVPTIAIKGQ
ncbi:MAG: Lrp/AsnC family transcriptional regulator [Janthinobacterium lividum]